MTTTDDTRTQLAAVLDDLATVVDAVGPDRLADPTPCATYDVAALREHALAWLTVFAAGFADPDGRAPADTGDYQVSADPAAEVRAAALTLDAALTTGAAERPLWLGESSLPGGVALGLVLAEYVLHGWDLATALGRPWAPPADAVDALLAAMPATLTDDYQGEGKPFGPRVAVAEDAPALDRLLGLTGRDPHWKPA